MQTGQVDKLQIAELIGKSNIDKELYEKFLNGDIDSFEQLVLKYKDNLIYFLQRYVKDVSTCEDIIQDVFAWIYVYKDKYNFTVGLKTYLFTIARNKAIDYIRKNQRLMSLDYVSLDNISDQNELAERVIKSENAKLLHTTISKLKQEYQTAIMLVDFEDMSYADVARIMEKSVPQFKILLFRARRSLKNMLGKEGYTHEN